MAKVYVMFASKDWSFFERLRTQAKDAHLQIVFDYMEIKKHWSAAWKAQCHNGIYQCDAAVVLISRNTQDGGADFELESASDFGMPMLGINVDREQLTSGRGELVA